MTQDKKPYSIIRMQSNREFLTKIGIVLLILGSCVAAAFVRDHTDSIWRAMSQQGSLGPVILRKIAQEPDFKNIGLFGVVLTASSLGLLLMYCARKNGLYASAFGVALGALAIRGESFLGSSPFSLLFAVMVLHLLESRRTAFLVPLICVMWANLDSGVLIAPLIVLGTLPTQENNKLGLVILGLSIIALVLTPRHIGIFSRSDFINSGRSLFTLNLLSAYFWFAVLCAILLGIRKRSAMLLSFALPSAVALLLGSKALFIILSIPLLSSAVVEAWNLLVEGELTEIHRNLLGVLGVLLSLLVLIVLVEGLGGYQVGLGLRENSFPFRAIDFLLLHTTPTKIAVSKRFLCFARWKLPHWELSSVEEGWSGTEYALVDYPTKWFEARFSEHTENSLPYKFYQDREWGLVWWGDLALVFARRNKSAERLLREHEYVIVEPVSLIFRGSIPEYLSGALEEAERKVWEEPSCRRARYFLAKILSSLGATAEASEQYHILMQFAPFRPEGYYGSASLFAFQEARPGSRKRALTLASSALAVAPDFAPALFLKGLLLAQQQYALPTYRQNFDEAIKWFTECLKADPEHRGAHNWLARLLYEQYGELDEAEKHIKKVLEHDPSDSLALFHLSAILKLRGENKSALERLETILKTSPSNPDALERRDFLREALGYYLEAKKSETGNLQTPK